MDKDKAIRSAKLTAAGILDKARARTAVTRAGGQIAPSKYLPNVPRQVHADGGRENGKRDFTRDNPGGEWLERKQARAAQYPDRKFVVGATTGVIGGRSNMFLPTHILKGIAGLNDEVRTAGIHKYDSLLAGAQKGGFDPDQEGNKVVVAVNHYGQPYLLEGNTRVAVAHAMGVPSVKAEVRYWNGAEKVDGPMHPDQVFGMASDDPDITKAGGGSVTDTDEFRNWFGNSVTHTDGDPHVFYTGTSKDKDFTSFNVGRHGAWFTRDPAEASQYAEQNDSQGYKHEAGWKLTPTNTASRVIPAYVKAENPYTGDLPDEVLRSNYKAAQSDWFDTLRRKGHDAWVPARYNGDLVVALKEPQQIKSIFNNGKFDPNQKHMNKAGGGEVDGEDDGITAYHGSPHSFDSFDISKLGTGEGAQAYGHGLYFAGNESIAKHYRDALGGNKSVHTMDGLPFDPSTISETERAVYNRVAPSKKTISEHLDELRSLGSSENSIQEMLPYLEKYTGRAKRTTIPAGHMYKVKLNVKPHELLDWDKPLSEQHPNIQRIAKEADISKAVGPTRGVLQAWREGRDVGVEATGRDLHQAISGYGEHGKQAADYLQSQGLKGIRYRDAGSRDLSDGDPTHNYVMFHHDPVQVVDKYEYGGAIPKARDVSAALALTRRFTKDGTGATMALKPKGK